MQNAQKRIRLGVIFLIMWMDVVGVSLFYPIAPYIVKQYSPDAMMVTLLAVLYSAAQFIAAPVLGRLSDRWGRRPVLLASLLGSAAAYVFFGLSGALWMLLTSRFVGGLAGGNMSTAGAYIADISEPGERARNFTLIGLAWGVGLIVGPALGAALAQWSLMAPAFVAAGLMLLNAVLAFFLLPESLPAEARGTGRLSLSAINPLSSIWKMVRMPAVGRLLVVLCLYNLAVNGTNSIGSLFMIDRFAAQSWVVGAYLTAIGIGVALIQLAVPVVVKRLGERRTVALTLAQQAVGGVAIFLSPSLAFFLPVALTNAWLGNFISAPMTAMQANRLKEGDVGMLMGVTASLNSLTSIFGPLWVGAVYDAVSPGAPYLVGTVLFLAAILLLAEGGPAALLCKGRALLAKVLPAKDQKVQ